MPVRHHRLLFVAAIGLALVWWGLMFFGTHMPMPPTTHVSVNDKIQHAGAYAGLAFLLLATVRALRWRTMAVYLGVVVLGAMYGVGDELTQLLVPNRSAELLDWVADVTGLILGAAAFGLVDWMLLTAAPWTSDKEIQSTAQP